LPWERVLESREGATTTWEVGLVAFERDLRRVHMEHDARCVQAVAAQHLLGLNNSSTSTRHWRSARPSFAYRI
jgi:hypothetical protein